MSDQQQQPRRHFPPHILRKTGELLTLFLEVIYADIAHNDEVCGVVARSLAVEHKAVWSQLGSEICPLVPIELLNAIDVYSARQTLLSAPELLALSPALRNSCVQFAAVLLEATDEEEEERQAIDGSETAESPSKQQQQASGWSVTSFAYKQALGRSLTTALQSSELHGLSTAGFQAVIDALNAIILRSLALAHFEFAPPKGTLLMRQLPNLWGELWAPVLRSAFLAAEQQCTAAWKQHQRQQQDHSHHPSSPPQRPSTSALKKRRREEEEEEEKVRNTSAEADRVIPKTFAEEVRSLFDTPRAPSAPPPLSIRRPLPPSAANASSTAKTTTLVDARVTEVLPEPRAAMTSKPSPSSTSTAPSQATTRRLLIAVQDSFDDAELRTALQATDARATIALPPTHRADEDPDEGVPPPPPTDETSLMTCDLSTVAPDSQTSAVSIEASSVVGAGAAAMAPSAGAALVLPLEERRPRVTIVEGPPVILNATGDAVEGGGEHPHQPPVAESHSTTTECARPSTTPTEGEELLSAEPLCRSLDAPVKARTYFLDPETKRFYPAVLRGFFA